MAQIGGNYNPIPEHPIIPVWEDWSTQYKQNGWVQSFSDLPPEEYAKTIFNVLGTVIISGNTGSTLITNQITSVYDTSGANYIIKATPKYAPSTSVTCTLEIKTSATAITKTLVIPAGTQSGTYITLDTGIPTGETIPTVTSTNINPPFDARYEYTFVPPQTPTRDVKVYYGVRKSEGATNITASEVGSMESIIATKEGVDIAFVIKSNWDKVRYCFIMAIPKVQKDVVTYKNILGFSSFVYMKDVTIDGVEYSIYWEHDDEDTTYKPKKTDEEGTFYYNIKLEE